MIRVREGSELERPVKKYDKTRTMYETSERDEAVKLMDEVMGAGAAKGPDFEELWDEATKSEHLGNDNVEVHGGEARGGSVIREGAAQGVEAIGCFDAFDVQAAARYGYAAERLAANDAGLGDTRPVIVRTRR